MDKEQKFPEQDAPVKNTDKAFVQVAEDGTPEMPAQEQGETIEEERDQQRDQH